MLYGTGELKVFFDTQEYNRLCFPVCVESFTFEAKTQTQPVKYLGEDGVIRTRDVLISQEEYVITLTIKDIDFNTIQLGLSELSLLTSANRFRRAFTVCPLTSSTLVDSRIITPDTFVFNLTDSTIMVKVDDAGSITKKDQYAVDSTTNTIEFHPDQVGTTLEILALSAGVSLGTVGDTNNFLLLGDPTFEGKFITTSGDGPYILSIPNMERIKGPELTSDGTATTIQYRAVKGSDSSSERKPFRIFAEAGFALGTDTLEVELFFANVPSEYEPESVLLLAGFVNIINNPDAVLIEDLSYQITFDLAEPGTEVQTFNTDSNGVFSVIYDVDSNLAFPEAGFLTVELLDTGDIVFQQAVSAKEPVLPEFTANLTGGDFEFSQIDVTGTGDPGDTVTLNTSNLGGLFDGATTVVETDGTWFFTGFLPASVTNGTAYTITAQHPGFANIILNGSVQVRNFAPTLTFVDQYKAGLNTTLEGDEEFRANQEYNLVIESPDLVFYDENGISSNNGTLPWTFVIPTSEQGKALTWTFTEISTTNTVVLNNTAPQFDIDMVLTVDTGQGDVVAGKDPITGTIALSQGHDVTIDIRNISDGLSYGNQFLQNSVNTATPQPWSIILSVNAPSGNYEVIATSAIHNTSTISPIPGTAATIQEGLEVNISEGLIYPGRLITFSGTGPAGATIDLDVFSTPYSTTAGNPDKLWSIDVLVSTGQALGPYTATVTTPALPSEVRTVDFDVEVEPLQLTSGCSGLLFSGAENPPMFNYTGKLNPDKDVTLTFTGLGGLLPVIITPDDDGIWEYSLSIPWQPSGGYSVTFTAPGETTIVCSDVQEGDIVLNPSINQFLQGDTGNSILLRGPDNTVLNVVVTGPLEKTESLLTDGSGFATLNLDDVPLLTPTPDSGTITVSTATATNSKVKPYTIEPRVPITIQVLNTPNTGTGLDVVFTNSTYPVQGNIPENGIYSFTSIGSTESFTLLSVVSDFYTASLLTSDVPGTAEITVATVFQPSESKTLIVSPPISFDVPSSMIINNLYDIKIFSEEGELVQVEITGSVDGIIHVETGLVPPGGEFLYVFDTTGLTEGQTISFIISNEHFSFLPQERILQGFSTGLPDSIIMDVQGVSSDKLVFPALQVRNLTTGLDNSPINEAGKLVDVSSDVLLTWTEPLFDDFLEAYLIESYTPGTSWTLLSLQTNQSIILTDPDLGYRINAIHEGQHNGGYQYVVLGDGLFAKTVSSFDVQGLSSSKAVVIPEGDTFYTFTTVRPEDEDPIQKFEVQGIASDTPPNIPEASLFFTFTTVRPEDEDPIQKFEVQGITSDTPLVIPEGTPFFTI